MRTEIPRQLVHLSGLFFVMLSVYLGSSLTAVLFLCMALFFLTFSVYIRSGRSGMVSRLYRVGYSMRRLFMRFERETGRPLMGPFWFYFSLFIAFMAFPMDAAFLAGIALSVGDALATLAGKALGRHGILPGKSLEGSAAFLAGSLAACLLFASPQAALAASLGGMAGELIPALPSLRMLSDKGVLNDNLTVPMLSGLSVWLVIFL